MFSNYSSRPGNPQVAFPTIGGRLPLYSTLTGAGIFSQTEINDRSAVHILYRLTIK
jgi:hypothetical protein